MITIYSKDNCPQCTATKKWLEEHEINYRTVDISENIEAVEMLVAKGFHSAPVVITDTDSWSGFNPTKLLKIKQS